jgi:hypothetical protein
MIYADNLFEIGKSHAICEDYSISKIKDNFGVIIVSDGCSSSSQTDIGARVLTIVAEKYITQNYKTILTINEDTLGQIIIHEAHSAIRALDLSEEVLDATLIICFVYNEKYRIIRFGDGVSIIGYKDGTSQINYTEYDEEYVYYLNYIYSNQRKEKYKEIASDEKTDISLTYGHEQNNLEKTKTSSSLFFSKIGDVKDLDYIIIGSDGLFSCSSSSNTSHEMFLSFLELKNLKGVFIKRRYKAWKKNLFKNGLNHDDDVSVAGFSFVDYKGDENDS